MASSEDKKALFLLKRRLSSGERKGDEKAAELEKGVMMKQKKNGLRENQNTVTELKIHIFSNRKKNQCCRKIT